MPQNSGANRLKADSFVWRLLPSHEDRGWVEQSEGKQEVHQEERLKCILLKAELKTSHFFLFWRQDETAHTIE